MDVQPLPPPTYVTQSDVQLQNDYDALLKKMQYTDPSSPEGIYYALYLRSEQIEMKVRKEMEEEDPDFNPKTQEGAKALSERLASNDGYQHIWDEIQKIIQLNPQESTSWGIPWGLPE